MIKQFCALTGFFKTQENEEFQRVEVRNIVKSWCDSGPLRGRLQPSRRAEYDFSRKRRDGGTGERFYEIINQNKRSFRCGKVE